LHQVESCPVHQGHQLLQQILSQDHQGHRENKERLERRAWKACLALLARMVLQGHQACPGTKGPQDRQAPQARLQT